MIFGRTTRRPRGRLLALAALLVAGLCACAGIGVHDAGIAHGRTASALGWVVGWGTAVGWNTTELGSADLTVRNVVHTSIGGSAVRIRLSNAFGAAPLLVAGVTVALPTAPGAASVAPGTLHTVTCGGAKEVTIPAGAQEYSDPVPLAVPAAQDLLVSVFVPASSVPASFHLHAQQESYYTAGDHAADTSAAAFTAQTPSWFYVDGVDVLRPVGRGTMVVFGDSITDGVTSTVGADQRWPDDLAARMRTLPADCQFGISNAGISGNRLLLDGNAPEGPGAAAGPSALARFDRDVLSRSDVRTVLLFEGINDIIQTPSQLDPAQIIEGLRQFITQAHAAGLTVIGATITPFQGWSDYDSQREAVRQAVNTWIRTSGAYDAVADFDAAVRDPADPHQLRPAYDSGDHLHPNDAGYAALAATVPLPACR